LCQIAALNQCTVVPHFDALGASAEPLLELGFGQVDQEVDIGALGHFTSTFGVRVYR
jgi:hypothetical protein